MAHSHETHTQTHKRGLLGWVATIFHLNGHSHDEKSLYDDPAFAPDGEGIRIVWLALLALGITSALQIIIVTYSGSVALMADTIHNVGDTLNSIPLLIAFYLARRAATRCYTYGYGRAEDLAGIIIVLSIAVSAAVVFWESFQKLLNPQPMTNIPWVVGAAIVGFVGNETVALLQIRVGRKIGSEALVADGLHARIDGFTSLAVLVAAFGTVIGLPILDPIVGLLIGVAILFITRDAAIRIWYRVMDAVDPAVVEHIEQYAGDIKGVEQISTLRVRWIGHQLVAEMAIVVDESLSLRDGHHIAETVRQTLLTHIKHLSEVTIHTDPSTQKGEDHHAPIMAKEQSALNILPPRYQLGQIVSAAPMGAAALEYNADGTVAWDQIWTGFCELALAGGPPHRGNLLEPVSPEAVAAQPEAYAQVLQELERGIRLVTGQPVVHSVIPGWIGLQCDSEEMALWLLRAIVVENISVRREDKVLYFPVGPDFRLEREIKNVITVIAKTYHYWQEHAQSLSLS